MSYRHKSAIWILAIVGSFAAAAFLHGELDARAVTVLLGLCFACELVDSGLGMGYGTILTPTLLLLGYEPAEIVPTVLFSELLSGFAASFFHHEIENVELGFRGRDLKPAALLASGGVLGVTAGVSLALVLPKAPLQMTIGCIVFLSGFFVVLLSRRAIEYRQWKMLGLSCVASFNKAISGGGYGPLVTSGQVLSGIKSKSAVGITSFAEAFTCLAAGGLYLVKGGYIDLTIFIPMAAGALLSVPFSVFAVKKANEDHLKIVIGLLTLAMGALTIFKAMS